MGLFNYGTTTMEDKERKDNCRKADNRFHCTENFLCKLKRQAVMTAEKQLEV